MGGFADEKPSSPANHPLDSESAEDSYPMSTLAPSSLHPNSTYSARSDAAVPYGNERESHAEEVEEALLTRHPSPLPPPQNVFTAPLKRIFWTLGKWIKGPQPPRRYNIKPVFPWLQIAPVLHLHRLTSKKTRFWLLISFCLLWGLAFLGTLGNSVFGCQVAGYGPPIRLSCVSRFW